MLSLDLRHARGSGKRARISNILVFAFTKSNSTEVPKNLVLAASLECEFTTLTASPGWCATSNPHAFPCLEVFGVSGAHSFSDWPAVVRPLDTLPGESIAL